MPSDADIWVVIEQEGGDPQEVTLEMLGAARPLADALRGCVAAVALGVDLQRMTSALGSAGADRAYLGEAPPLEIYTTDAYASVLESAIRAENPRMVLIADSPNGRDLAPRLAARLGVGLATGCTAVNVDADGHLVAIRPMYGQLQATFRFGPTRPAMVTIRPGALGVPRPMAGPPPSVEMIAVDVKNCASRTQVRGVLEPDPATVQLSEAEIVVAGGRGVGGPGRWHLVEQFAAALGAAVGGSRVAADQGSIGAERVIGQTGQFIAPKLYVAVGISGASQHACGVRDARCIVSVNRDRGAPLSRMADLALVGDLHAVLPLATRMLRAERERGQDKTGGKAISP